MKIFGEIPDARIPASGLIYQILPGGNEITLSHIVQGYYIHPDLFHDVCYWANKPYAVKVSRLMNLINERNRLLNQTLEKSLSRNSFGYFFKDCRLLTGFVNCEIDVFKSIFTCLISIYTRQ